MTAYQVDPTTERLAIAALLADQQAQAHAARWLRVEDFTDGAATAAWRAVLHLRAQHGYVDRDQLQAEMRRQGHLDHPRKAADLAGVLDAKVPSQVSGTHYAKAVLEASLRRAVDKAGLELHQLSTADLPPGKLLDAARERTARLGIAAERWHAATHEVETPVPETPEDAAIAQARRMVEDLTGPAEDSSRAYAEGLRHGYQHGYQIGHAHAENELEADWANVARNARGRANEPSHAELMHRRDPDRHPKPPGGAEPTVGRTWRSPVADATDTDLERWEQIRAAYDEGRQVGYQQGHADAENAQAWEPRRRAPVPEQGHDR